MFHVRVRTKKKKKKKHNLLCYNCHMAFIIVLAFVLLLNCESVGLFRGQGSIMNSSPVSLQSCFEMTAALLVYISSS